MFETPPGGERAILVHVDFSTADVQEELDEFRDLAVSAGADPLEIVVSKRYAPEAKYFIGTGKAEAIKTLVTVHSADLVLINHALTPAQERNLERLFKCRVLDRIGLILDIFAQRARTFEGKLQVELAQLQHMSTRLVRGWTHLERQKGGIGLRGPGETQLETDRRLLRNRIKYLHKRLDKVRSTRNQGRRARQKAYIPTISLVGYTNAGKSTLFNRLTNAEVYAADQLFATLDPTLRQIKIPHFGTAILVDTVGFIRHLPHDLVDAFRATLEETQQADLLLHVVDAVDEKRRSHIEQVEEVLEEINALDVPLLQVYNKIDLLDEPKPRIERDKHGVIRRVWVSANSGAGISELIDCLAECLSDQIITKSIHLKPHETGLRAKLYDLDSVLAERIDDEGNYFLSIRLPKDTYERLTKQRKSEHR